MENVVEEIAERYEVRIVSAVVPCFLVLNTFLSMTFRVMLFSFRSFENFQKRLWTTRYWQISICMKCKFSRVTNQSSPLWRQSLLSCKQEYRLNTFVRVRKTDAEIYKLVVAAGNVKPRKTRNWKFIFQRCAPLLLLCKLECYISLQRITLFIHLRKLAIFEMTMFNHYIVLARDCNPFKKSKILIIFNTRVSIRARNYFCISGEFIFAVRSMLKLVIHLISLHFFLSHVKFLEKVRHLMSMLSFFHCLLKNYCDH